MALPKSARGTAEMIPLPEEVRSVIARLEETGAQAWAVGGCVRDSLLGRTPKDYDVTTSLRPAQVAALFAHVVPSGQRYGTVTVLLDGRPVEVTTFREEGEYRDARHPSRVAFTASLEADLARRDFTVNAMAYHPARGLADPFGGRADLAAGLLRAVGEPAARFAEDALRILRAYRFAAQLDFRLDAPLRAAARECAPRLGQVSAERKCAELKRLLTSPRPDWVWVLAEEIGPVCGLPAPAETQPAGERTGARGTWPAENAFPIRMAWALWGLGATAETAQAALRALRCSNQEIRQTVLLLRLLESPAPADTIEAKRLLRRAGPAGAAAYCALLEHVRPAQAGPVRALLDAVLRSDEPYQLSMLALRGDALAPWVPAQERGAALEALLEHVLHHPQDNTQAALLRLLRARAKEDSQ